MSDKNPWQAVLSVWRGVLHAFRQLPLLVVGCLLTYTFLSAYWRHYFPVVVPSGLASQLGYILLHAAVFAPVVLGTILAMTRSKIVYADIWVAQVASVGAIVAIREIGRFALTASLHLWRPQFGAMLFPHGEPSHQGWFYLAGTFYFLRDVFPLLVVFLLSVRLILVLPLLALGATGWKSAILDAWRAMRGHYGFALAVSIAALLPVIVSDYFLGRFYARLSMASDLPVLPAVQWEALLVRSAELTFDYIVMAALAAGLYRAIRPGPAATRLHPYPSDALSHHV